ncbi:hypothetical protein BT69DRAFT_1281883 [Atractiella rhizophila]|nr:hypothetical protein BT69DRAFT_1281883 [Atractiella rhizophila]
MSSRAPTPPQSSLAPISNQLKVTPRRTTSRSSCHSQASQSEGADEAKLSAAQEMKGRFVYMDVEAFLDLLPPGPVMPEPTAPPTLSDNENFEHYNPSLIEYMSSFVGDWKLANTSQSNDGRCFAPVFGSDRGKPDVTLYHPSCEIEQSDEGTKGYKADMTRAELFGEFKVKKESDPLEDTVDLGTRARGIVETESQTGQKTRGQIIIYSTMVLSSQQRTRVFSFYVRGHHARLICHSRAGFQVTHSFDYSKDAYLQEFFWRYTNANREARGHDVTFVLTPNGQASDRAREVLKLSTNAPLFTVSVGMTGAEARQFYVSTPFTYRHNVPVGRGTRCFRAFDPEGATDEEQRVFLKDTWRNVGYAKAEGEIYELLKEKGVPHVLKPVAHGDVPGMLQLASVGEKSLRHYRLVLDKVVRPLWEFPSTKCLIQALADALEAHQKAFDSSGGQASILHRDISEGNILFDDNRRGFLCDWELARVGEGTSEANERTGTEEFMSLRLLASMVDDSPMEHEVQDDMESMVYVLLWSAASYAASNMNPYERGRFLSNFDRVPFHELSASVEARRMVIGSQSTVESLKLSAALAFKEVLEEVMTALRLSVLGLSRELKEAKKTIIRLTLEKQGPFTEEEVEAVAVREEKRLRSQMGTHDCLRKILRRSLLLGDWGDEKDKAYNHEVRRPGQKIRKRKGTALPSSQASKQLRGPGSGHIVKVAKGQMALSE